MARFELNIYGENDEIIKTYATDKARYGAFEEAIKFADEAEGKTQAEYYRDVVKTAMEDLRTPIDKLEIIVDKNMWPMPSYGDLIFEV